MDGMDGMDMGHVEEWFVNLPLSDSRCNNESCAAWEAAFEASTAAATWESQFNYGYWLTWIYAIVIFLFAVNFLLAQRLLGAASSRHASPGLHDKAAALVRRLSYRRFESPRLLGVFSLPSWGVIGMAVVFLAAVLAFSFAQQPYYRPTRAMGSSPLGVRTGVMAFALLTIEIALAGKVNIITWITGIGHEKLNVFHRINGWLILFLSLVHTIPFFYQPAKEGGAAQVTAQFYSPMAYEFTGVPPLAMLVGLVFFAISPLRRLAYEVFVQLHMLLAIAFLGLCFWHAIDCLDSWNYLWAAMAFWLFSLSFRTFSKTSFFGFGFCRTWFSECDVALTRLPGGMVRVDVAVPGQWTWEPGQHVFLRFLKMRPLDNHPFTIANSSINATLTTSTLATTTMTFYVRPNSGITARIGALAAKGSSGLRVSVEGPYGTIVRPRVESHFDKVVLVAGGGGISGALPWLDHLTGQMKAVTADAGKQGLSRPPVCVDKSIHLVWAVRSRQSIEWVARELSLFHERAAAAGGVVQIDIWVTDEPDGAAVGRIDGEGGEEKGEKTDLETGSAASAPTSSSACQDLVKGAHFSGRPDMRKLLPSLVGQGRTMVLGCGPESLKIDLSNTVAGLQARVGKGEAVEVRLHTETFGW